MNSLLKHIRYCLRASQLHKVKPQFYPDLTADELLLLFRSIFQQIPSIQSLEFGYTGERHWLGLIAVNGTTLPFKHLGNLKDWVSANTSENDFKSLLVECNINENDMVLLTMALSFIKSSHLKKIPHKDLLFKAEEYLRK